MSYVLRLKCPECAETFKATVESDDDLPNFCQHCGAYVGGDEDFVPSNVNIRTAVSVSADATYRAIERSSADRAEMAGDPSLKVTDLNDSGRVGEIAAKAPNNDVTRFADQTGHQYWGGAGPGGVQTQSAVAMAKTGQARDTGAMALSAIQGGSLPKVRVPAAVKGRWGG